MDTLAQLPELLQRPLFEPNFLNVEYLFNLLLRIPSFVGDLLRALATGELPEAEFGLRIMLIGLLVLAALLALAIAYLVYRIREVRKQQQERYRAIERGALREAETERRNERWEAILDHADMPSEADWRLAIIEADAMLDDMLIAMGYAGDTMGDRLKSVHRGDMATLDAAWEVHKIRNRIAHEGKAFELSKREVQRVIDLYRQVFEEMHYI